MAKILWGMGGFFGISLLFTAAPWLYGMLKPMGGGYLVWLGIRLLKEGAPGDGASSALPNGDRGPLAAFRSGFLTTIANPKTAAFVASLFAAAMPPDAPVWLGLLSVALMVAISAVRYSLVAFLFSIGPVQTRHRKARVRIDRLAGALFAGFGVKLAVGD
jgi:threonine/homoserine/homoserine lactone efflux protein